ncbi:D-alanyl-D-alanine carboxypeptidase [Streptomyces sp. NBC_00252]|uniref:D-alanyl-D-alanine carboxypeptidase n=1 Tax=Streptomyces sp. NBC_00252 TaxID=2975691 RepID=UPI002E2DCE62|nr:D-alanyl-D-alanine carboxypeptidase [Streptomyces sp. NBC_00252]
MDTATKVFSIKDLRTDADSGTGSGDSGDSADSGSAETPESPESADEQNPSAKDGTAGDARLRAAVAAWVTSADGTEGPADGKTPAKKDSTASERTADAEVSEDAGELTGSEMTDEDAQGSARVADAGTSENTAEPTEATGKRAGTAGESSTSEDAEATATAPAVDDPEDAEGAVAAEADRDAGKPGEAASGDAGAAHEPTEGEASAAEPGSDDDVTEGERAADAEDASTADKATEATDTGSDDPEDAVPETDGTAAAEAGKADAADATDPKADTPAATSPAKATPDPRTAEAKATPATDAATAPKTAEADAETDAEAEGDAGTDTDGDAEAEGDAKPEDAKPEDAKPEDAKPEDAEPEGDAAPDVDAEAEGDADGGDSEPRAADGEDAPQAPPAPDDETRTGGAGGKPETAEGEAEAEALDHPTTVFKAVRPPKPEVDQPTTMLKLGGATKPPKTPESAPERTSKFVALKPLDEPRTPRRDTPPKDATRPVPHVGPEHTTQQPLPPKPPLDLLAELTNTPPPPETPVRTAVRRVKIWTPLVILLAIVFAVVQAVRPLPTPSLTLTAEDSYTFDGSKANLPWPTEGQGWMDVNGIGTMGNFGKQTPVAIGSVAKAMTAYIVLKDHPLKAGTEGEKITVDATAEKEGGYDKDGESTLNTVKAGDVLTEKQALSAIMIPSANNIARLLARWDAGTEAAFIKKMNATAKELGMTNTTYTDASGLKETTVSSAEDQVKLGNELVKIPALMDITKLPSWVDPSGHKWTNYNRLVPYNNSLGIKTGTTTAAGGNLLFAATKEVGGETAVIVGAILGQHTAPIIDTVNAVSKTAMLGAQDAMTSAKILKKGTVVGYVDDQLGGHTPVVVTKDVAAVGWAGLKVKLSFAADDVPHTAKAGTKVGTLTVGDGSGGAVKVPVALQKDLAEPALTSKLTRLG